jgi:hypothetical protein
MKKITGLDDKIVPLISDADTPLTQADDMPTVRQCLIVSVGKGNAKSADEARRCVRVVNKLRVGDNVIELADEEFLLVLQKVVANPNGFIADIQGQLIEKLDPSKD